MNTETHQIDTACSHLIISCHPNTSSFTYYVAHQVHTHLLAQNIISQHFHLDSISYNPLLTQDEISRRASFDRYTILFQQYLSTISTLTLCYPDWWGLPPALLVGWMQRVFAPGVAFVHDGDEFMPKHHTPLLSHLKVILAVHSDEQDSSIIQLSTNLLQKRVFAPSGIDKVHSILLAPIYTSTTHQKNQWITQIIHANQE